ncbi:MAG: FHA domain-containing protein [Propionibacteriaceae bacterium]|jgi:hypothetical protein|nr:FHA domain-containing protein [Propionibacteriaceae bacterium]
MGRAGKAERKLEDVVGGLFARVFKGDVQPVEITQRLQRELDTEAQVLSRDKFLVPNDFLIGLSKHDYAKLFPYSRTMNAQISDELRDYAADHDYVFNGPLMISYEERPDLSIGRFDVVSETVAEVASSDSARFRLAAASLVLEVNGVRHPLSPPGFVIGRGSEADLRINDPGISRRHAQIIVDEGTEGYPIVKIVDLGSTNGIYVDGRRVEEADLFDGSRIDIGRTQMLVYAPSGN